MSFVRNLSYDIFPNGFRIAGRNPCDKQLTNAKRYAMLWMSCREGGISSSGRFFTSPVAPHPHFYKR